MLLRLIKGAASRKVDSGLKNVDRTRLALASGTQLLQIRSHLLIFRVKNYNLFSPCQLPFNTLLTLDWVKYMAARLGLTAINYTNAFFRASCVSLKIQASVNQPDQPAFAFNEWKFEVDESSLSFFRSKL